MHPLRSLTARSFSFQYDRAGVKGVNCAPLKVYRWETNEYFQPLQPKPVLHSPTKTLNDSALPAPLYVMLLGLGLGVEKKMGMENACGLLSSEYDI